MRLLKPLYFELKLRKVEKTESFFFEEISIIILPTKKNGLFLKDLCYFENI